MLDSDWSEYQKLDSDWSEYKMLDCDWSEYKCLIVIGQTCSDEAAHFTGLSRWEESSSALLGTEAEDGVDGDLEAETEESVRLVHDQNLQRLEPSDKLVLKHRGSDCLTNQQILTRLNHDSLVMN